MGNNVYALLDDGTLWRRIGRHWRTVTKVPDLPPRRVGASSQVIVRLTGEDLRYEPDQPAKSSLVITLEGLPTSISEARPARMLVVKDSTVALLDANGGVFSTGCRIERVVTLSTGPPEGSLRCSPLTQLLPSGRVAAIDILSDGAVIGVGPGGLVVTWRQGVGKLESLPAVARADSLWAIVASSGGRATAIGSRRVLERDSRGRWSVVRELRADWPPNSRFQVLPDGDLVVLEHSIQVWDRRADSLPVTIIYRPVPGQVIGALHVLQDGRLIAGLANPEEPALGGGLIVWAAPARENRSQRLSLPIRVDITDLADDGRYLLVVGKGGSLRIPLDSLPFAKSSD
jgi:hypothetical protein